MCSGIGRVSSLPHTHSGVKCDQEASCWSELARRAAPVRCSIHTHCEELARDLPRISVAPVLCSNRRHRCVSEPTRDGEQVIPSREEHACLKCQLVHRSQHAPIFRTTESDRLHGSNLACHRFARHTERFEQRADGSTQTRCKSGSQGPCREKYCQQRTLACLDGKFCTTEAYKMDVPVAEPACRGRRFGNRLPRQV